MKLKVNIRSNDEVVPITRMNRKKISKTWTNLVDLLAKIRKSFGCPLPPARHFRAARIFLNCFYFTLIFSGGGGGGAILKAKHTILCILLGSKSVPLPVCFFHYAILYLLNLSFIFFDVKMPFIQIRF